jgi:hypothetical protein
MTISTHLTDHELLRQFEDTSLPATLFDHRQHVRVAWLYVTRYGMPEAINAFATALRRFADAKGAHTLFHATITWAYLLLIHERQQAAPADDFEAFAAANADLLRWKPSILDSYYTADVLWSDRARATFLMPNRGLAR